MQARGMVFARSVQRVPRASDPTRFDGPPRVVVLRFQLANRRFIGPQDMFGVPSFDEARRLCKVVGEPLRRGALARGGALKSKR